MSIKRLLILLSLFAFLAVGGVGCSSGDAEGDEADVVESEDLEGLEELGDDEFSDDFDGDDFAEDSDEGFGDGDEYADEEGFDDEEEYEDVAEGEEGFDDSEDYETDDYDYDYEDEEVAGGDALADDEMAGLSDAGDYDVADVGGSDPIDMGVPEDDPGLSAFDDSSVGGFEDETPKWIPVKKMKDTPFRRGGYLANALYVARAGDTMESVSSKIYGTSDRAEELLTINPTLTSGLRVGDKIYHNSPTRPNDELTLLTAYEDKNLSPEFYVSQSGDNIRAVAQNLLGHERSWMEVWATNPDVESKGEISEGVRLRYWSASDLGPGAQMDMAASEMPSSNDIPPPPGMNDIPPPPDSTDLAMNDDLPPPPDMPDTSMDEPPPPPPPADMDAPPPPPPPAASIAPPPPPPPKKRPPRPTSKASASTASADDNQTMAVAAGAIILIAGVLLFIIIRKRKRRNNIDFQTATHTQID